MSTVVTSFGRPQSGEYSPYHEQYISLVQSDDIVGALERQGPETARLLGSAEAKADFRYAPGKWSVKEIAGHINDAERIMVYRALRIARGDKTPIEGFEQDDYVRDGNFGQRTLRDLVEEFTLIRRATIAFFRHLDPEAALRRGTANNNEISVRAVAFIIAGHEMHHRGILRGKYLR